MDGTITIQIQDPTDFDPRLGKKLGQYIVAARVADGAMGRVYEGRHPETKQQIAIKVLHEDVAKDEVAVERFKREYESAEELDHGGIVKVLEFGETDDGSWFLNMEYLSGRELTKAIEEEGALRPARTLRVFCQLAEALDHAHSFGFIHRDLKPDNVFLVNADEGDVVRVLDFGSVKLQMEVGPKLTAFGTTLGSPYYMSPEQAMGKLDVDQRTDVFAIAAILWEMATGRVAFEGANVAQILMKIVNEDPAPPSSFNAVYPKSFDDVVIRGVHKDKTKRPASAGELADLIVASFGLDGDHKRWAQTTLPDIERALSTTAPPPPAAYGQEPIKPPIASTSEETGRVTHAMPPPSQVEVAPQASGGNSGMLVAIAVAVAVLAAGVAAFIALG